MKSTAAHTQTVKFLRETENAIHVEVPNGDQMWIPFSQVASIEREANGIDGTITMSKWIAQQKGLL